MREPRRRPVVLLSVAAWGVVVLALSASAAGLGSAPLSQNASRFLSSETSGPAGPFSAGVGPDRGPDYYNGSPPITVSLDESTSNVEVGGPVTFQLNFQLAYCGPVFSMSSVTLVSLALGDGFSYQEPGPGGSLYCAPPGSVNSTWVDELFQYAYSSPGSYSVRVQVNWTLGSPLVTNTVTVDVTGSSLAFAIDGWFYGVTGTVGVGLAACVVFRSRLPQPPSLPPGAT